MVDSVELVEDDELVVLIVLDVVEWVLEVVLCVELVVEAVLDVVE